MQKIFFTLLCTLFFSTAYAEEQTPAQKALEKTGEVIGQTFKHTMNSVGKYKACVKLQTMLRASENHNLPQRTAIYIANQEGKIPQNIYTHLLEDTTEIGAYQALGLWGRVKFFTSKNYNANTPRTIQTPADFKQTAPYVYNDISKLFGKCGAAGGSKWFTLLTQPKRIEGIYTQLGIWLTLEADDEGKALAAEWSRLLKEYYPTKSDIAKPDTFGEEVESEYNNTLTPKKGEYSA